MLKLLKLKNYGWTNLLYLADMNNEKVVVKKFNYDYKTAFTHFLYICYCVLSFKGNNGFSVSNKARVRNEIEAKMILGRMGIKVQRLISIDGDALILENIKGDNLNEFFKKQNDRHVIEKMGFRKGLEIGKIHNHDCALVDNRITNTIVTEDLETYSIDHEFFIKNAKDFQKELDIITLMSTVPYNKFEIFYKGFSRGYKKMTNKDARIQRKDLFVFMWIILNFLIRANFLKS